MTLSNFSFHFVIHKILCIAICGHMNQYVFKLTISDIEFTGVLDLRMQLTGKSVLTFCCVGD